MGVGDVARDEPVAVQGDRGDVEYRRRTAEHIRRRPEVAQHATEMPLSADHFLHGSHFTRNVQSVSRKNYPLPPSVKFKGGRKICAITGHPPTRIL